MVRHVFALDFDGVLCDSVAETAVTGWRAGRRLWPEWQADEPPAAALEQFVALRPLLETGYQAILLMHMVCTGVPEDEIGFDPPRETERPRGDDDAEESGPQEPFERRRPRLRRAEEIRVRVDERAS